MRLAVIVPCYNEGSFLEVFISEWSVALENTDYKLFIIDDGSNDNSCDLVNGISKQNDRVTCISKVNSGHGLTCRFGYEYALNLNEFDYILQIDSDGQCDPTYFPKFLELSKKHDAVFGVRTTRGDGIARKLTSFLCTLVTSILTRCVIRDANVPYRLIRSDILAQAIKSVPSDFYIQNVALTVALKRLPNISWGYVPMHFRDRTMGTNSINLLNVAQLGLKMISELSKIK
jgi:glycosyltransferase involved in cell wall biosynthesis